MAVGLAASIAAELLDALFNADAYTGPAAIYAKLHVGDPGAAGTGNPAGNTTRQAVSFGTATGGAIANDGAVVWTNVNTNEDYTFISLWTDVSAGSFLGSGAVVSNSVSIGDTYTLATGDIDVVISPVAA